MAFDVITPTKLGAGAVGVTPTITTFYTTPANTRTLVKSIDVANSNANDRNVTVFIGLVVLVPGVLVPGNSILQWEGVQVLNVGDTIRAMASGSDVTLHVSGGEAV